MCMFKSGIILKDSVYLGETMNVGLRESESHTEMLKALKIDDTKKNAETLFVRAELLPSDDVFSDIDKWKFKVDQDIIPNWFVQEYEETRMRDAVKEWAKTHIFVGVDGLELTEGSGYCLKDCTNVKISGTANVQRIGGNSIAILYNNRKAILFDNSKVVLRNESTARLWDNSTAELFDNSKAVLRNESKAELYDESKVALWNDSAGVLFDNSKAILWNESKATLYDNSTAELYGYNTAILYDESTGILFNDSEATLYSNSKATLYNDSKGILPDVESAGKKENYVLMGNSTLKDCKTKTIYRAGDWKSFIVDTTKQV